VKLDPEAVSEIIADAKHPIEYLEGIFKLVFPEWDEIETIEDWPECNRTTWLDIADQAMKRDTEILEGRPHNDRYMPGGPWMNSGFGTNDDGGELLADYEIRRCCFTRKAV
jgi:hypothetical protein